MARGRNKHGRGKLDGSDQQSHRGRGGGGRGGRGRGGQKHPGRVPGSSFLQEELDVTIQMYADSPNPQELSEYSTLRGGGRGRGRGRGRGYTPREYTSHLRGNGQGVFDNPGGNTPRGRGRGDLPGYSPKRGRGLGASVESTPSKPGLTSTLSDLLFASRPFLRPVKFVQSTQTPFLFTCDEEILQPVTEGVGDDVASHVPTADRVERIFHGANNPFGNSSSSSSSEGEEEIEEIDFNDMDKLLSSPKQEKATTNRRVKVDSVLHMVEDQIEAGFYQITTPHPQPEKPTTLAPPIPMHATELDVPLEKKTNTINQDIPPLFVVDTQPSTLPTPLEFPRAGTPPEDEEVIVYVAPHPRVRTRSRVTSVVFDDIPGVSAFKPYSPPATLALASMSIREDDTATAHPQPQKQKERQSPPKSPSPTQPTATPLPIPTVENLKFAFPSRGGTSRSSTPGRKPPAVMTPRMAKKHSVWERKTMKRERRRKKGRHGHFAAFGALLSEAKLHDDVLSDKDPKLAARRRGDSDVDWGTESGDGGSVHSEVDVFSMKSEKAKGKEKEVEIGEDGEGHGMQVDGEMDIEAMKSFVGGLIGREAGRFMTMDDIGVEDMIKDEDEEGLGNGPGTSSDGEAEVDEGSVGEDDGEGDNDELEEILRLEEKLLLGESSDDESEDGDDFSPKSSFQARLEKLRARSRHKRHIVSYEDDDDDDDDMLKLNMAWAQEVDDHDDIEDHIQDLLEQFKGKGGVDTHFRAIHTGDFVDMQPAKKRKDKGKDLPEELNAMWERDRQKKAERRRERELEKLIQAADPFSRKKGGKKGRKAMLAAAHLDPTIDIIPNRIIDTTTLVQQIRRFVADIGGPGTMSLPPANKETRKNVHELALAFGLKSQSKGKGNARYTTLSKTTMTGAHRVDERKIAKIVRRAGGAGARGDAFGELDGGRRAPGVPKHREGDEVGATAPKIGAGNVGFKMLSAMGWSEGNKIGLSGGLEAPLVAIIKHSKLGLGATKQ